MFTYHHVFVTGLEFTNVTALLRGILGIADTSASVFETDVAEHFWRKGAHESHAGVQWQVVQHRAELCSGCPGEIDFGLVWFGCQVVFEKQVREDVLASPLASEELGAKSTPGWAHKCQQLLSPLLIRYEWGQEVVRIAVCP